MSEPTMDLNSASSLACMIFPTSFGLEQTIVQAAIGEPIAGFHERVAHGFRHVGGAEWGALAQ